MIRARGLERRFGDKRVIAGLDLDVADRDFLVVVGPNGSGKSTLLGLLSGLLAPTRGSLEIAVTRGEIGLLAHEALVYRELTALENLELYGRLYRLPERRERIGMLLERYGLWEARHQRVVEFSRAAAHPDAAALVAGIPYAAVAFCSVFILMFEGRTATFAGLVNRLTSLLAGTTATLVLWLAFGMRFPTAQDWVSVAFILVAVGFLSVAERRRTAEKASERTATPLADPRLVPSTTG